METQRCENTPSWYGTPINMKPTTPLMKKAKVDYMRAKEELHGGNKMTWDSNSVNGVVPGDYFAFVQKNGAMEIFRVIAVEACEQRIKEWDIKEHRFRQVLVLSESYTTIMFSEYKNRVGYSGNHYLHGTTRMRALEGEW